MRRVPQVEEAHIRLTRLQQVLSQPIEVYTGGDVINLSPGVAAAVGQPDDTPSSLIERLSTTPLEMSNNGHEPTFYLEEAEQPPASRQ
jgi:hypothetical protein